MSSASPDGRPTFWRRTGTRVLAIQAASLVVAFSVAGVVARSSIERLEERSLRRDVVGEAASLDAEWRKKGVAHLPFTIRKRLGIRRSFGYGLADASGTVLAGDPVLARAPAGWSTIQTGAARFVSYVEPLPGGARLTVGRNLAALDDQLSAITAVLAMSGLAAVSICLVTAWLTTRWTSRRLDQLAAAAALVADGRLDVRAPVRRARAPDEVDTASLAFNAMLDRIGRLVDQLRRVTTDVAHDMRRPLNRLRQKLERLARSATATPAIAEEVARLDAEFEEIIRTFDALLQLAELEGSSRPEGMVDLGEVAGRVSEALRPDIEESGRHLDVRALPLKVRGDTDLMAQALLNLMENALRHTPRGSHIELRVEPAPNAARLVVRDDGPGIPAELRDLALAPFGRLEASRSAPGSGIGLAIAASIAVRHGARLELDDAAPGLEASISFPT